MSSKTKTLTGTIRYIYEKSQRENSERRIIDPDINIERAVGRSIIAFTPEEALSQLNAIQEDCILICKKIEITKQWLTVLCKKNLVGLITEDEDDFDVVYSCTQNLKRTSIFEKNNHRNTRNIIICVSLPENGTISSFKYGIIKKEDLSNADAITEMNYEHAGNSGLEFYQNKYGNIEAAFQIPFSIGYNDYLHAVAKVHVIEKETEKGKETEKELKFSNTLGISSYNQEKDKPGIIFIEKSISDNNDRKAHLPYLCGVKKAMSKISENDIIVLDPDFGVIFYHEKELENVFIRKRII